MGCGVTAPVAAVAITVLVGVSDATVLVAVDDPTTGVEAVVPVDFDGPLQAVRNTAPRIITIRKDIARGNWPPSSVNRFIRSFSIRVISIFT